MDKDLTDLYTEICKIFEHEEDISVPSLNKRDVIKQGPKISILDIKQFLENTSENVRLEISRLMKLNADIYAYHKRLRDLIKVCPKCQGKQGEIVNFFWIDCTHCNGDGVL